MVSEEDFQSFSQVISLWELSVSPSNESFRKFYHILRADIRDILLSKCELMMSDTIPLPYQYMYLTWHFSSGELKRQLRMQGAPNPSIFICFKQFRSYQNDLTGIQNVKKTALAIFYFSSFDTNCGSYKIPWHFPDILSNIHFSLTQHKIPWQFPDLEKKNFPDISLTRMNPVIYSESSCCMMPPIEVK